LPAAAFTPVMMEANFATGEFALTVADGAPVPKLAKFACNITSTTATLSLGFHNVTTDATGLVVHFDDVVFEAW
jgi:hypothetical protein